MFSSHYLGPSHRNLDLSTWEQVVTAAAAGVLDETQWVELKKDIPPATPRANLEAAKDLASLSVDGGLLIVGVEDDKGKAGAVVGTQLAGLVDRLAQVAASRVTPPLSITTQVVRHPDDPDRGILLVTIPASLTAPHMVDDLYWGRSATGKRPLSDPEVRRLIHERERHQERFDAELRALPSTFAAFDGPRERAHTHFLAAPQSAGSPIQMADALGERSALQVIREAVMFGKYPPSVEALTTTIPHPEGYETRSASESEEYAYRVLLGDDGDVRVATGRLSHQRSALEPRSIMAGHAVEVVHGGLLIAGHVGGALLGYQGPWSVGVVFDGLQGLVSPLAWSTEATFGGAYPNAEYVRTTSTTTQEMLQRPRDVVVRLLHPFLRVLRAEAYLDYEDPRAIGSRVPR